MTTPRATTRSRPSTARPGARLVTAILAAAATAAACVLVAAPASAAARTAPADRPATGTHHGDACVLALPDGFRPEGVEAGPGGRLFAGSLADGRIQVLDRRTGRSRLLLPGVEGRALRGLRYDGRSGLLWAVGNDGPTGVVLAVRARTGALERRIEVPGAVFLNDLDVTRSAVWVSDSRVDRLTRIALRGDGRPAAGEPVNLAITGDWPAPDGIRANGIRALDRHTLLVVNSTAAVLRTVDTRTGVATAVRVTGTTLTGGDGLVLRGRTLFVVRGTGQDSVAQFRLTAKGHGKARSWTARHVRDLTDPALDVPSTATLAGGRLWAVNARFGVADPATAAYQVVGLPLGR